MTITFSLTDAGIILALLSSVIIPFATSWLKQVHWPDYAKWGLAVGLSLLAGALAAYSSGQLTDHPLSIIELGSLILSLSTGIYHTAFKGLGLEAWLNPPTPEPPPAPAA